jgi:hypothetical protein
MLSTRQDMVDVVGAGALTIGVGHVIAPNWSGRFWGLAPQTAPVVPHVIRLYGLSLIGLGAVIVRTTSEQDLVMSVATGVATGTALTGLLGGLRGRVGRRSMVMTVLAAGGLGALAGSALRSAAR